MAGFEVIVRPVVFPNIRPAPARALAPEDNPEQGTAVFSGSGGKLIDLTRTETISWSKSRATETKRTVVPVRIYQEEEDGTVNRDNFVDTKQTKKMSERDAHEDKEHEYIDPVYTMLGRENMEQTGPEEVIYNPNQPTSSTDDRGDATPPSGDGGGTPSSRRRRASRR